ncbi:kynurenine aminotransferase-like [Homalodisca vitripennis]|uniref:kynurenine aminotransferase-like n=1 Tax=Homalodisca vitripennis TaxID=197043 RepID=UPI001EEA3785|nr:kynurenine aminotransferase-like [Homalodisca vitripennis]
MSSQKFSLPLRFSGSENNLWVEYIQLAQEYKPLNLGQGFPDFAPPEFLTKALAEVANGDNVLLHQYTGCFGHHRLVVALSKYYSQLIGRELNPKTEIIVTSGAFQAVFNCIQGHTSPGDEIIIIEPFFDCYEPMVRAVGGVPVFIPLRLRKPAPGKPMTSSDWVLDPEELESKFSSKTKAIIVNNPHNPVGKVFSLEELTFIADLCKKWDVLYISDEVYEHLIYKPFKHIRAATLPNMWERTITIGSAGKTFSVTGWKTGWAYGPAPLIRNLMVVHQNSVYAQPTPIQEAVAMGLELEMTRLGQPESYFQSLPRELEAKRDYMVALLKEVGMEPTVPQAGYFILADWTELGKKIDLSSETDKYKDYKFTKWMSKNVKLQGIPPSAFYSGGDKHLAENFVRYCFIKKDENLQKAAHILRTWKQSIQQ